MKIIKRLIYDVNDNSCISGFNVAKLNKTRQRHCFKRPSFRGIARNLDMSFIRHSFSHLKVAHSNHFSVGLWDFYSRHIFFSLHQFISPRLQNGQTNTHTCAPKDINVSQVTSISQMLWACFKARGIPWQESHSTFRRNFFRFQNQHCWIWIGRAGPTRLALVTSFYNPEILCLV